VNNPTPLETEPAEIPAPPGLRPGDVPSGIQWPQRLWVILPPTPSSAQATMHRAILARAESVGLNVTSVQLVASRGRGGLQFKLMQPQDVAGLYKSIHRFRTGILALSGAKILLDISESPTNQGCVSLETFVKYKCVYRLASRPEEVDVAFEDLINRMSVDDCDGYKDPRCLPTAIFVAKKDIDLRTYEGRADFMGLHRVAHSTGSLRDGLRRTWELGPSHTRDLIHVAGRCLPLGFHWDVQTQRDTVMVNGWERWEVPGQRYTNVHPDGFIRGGSATCTHSLRQVSKADKPRALTPKAIRQAKGHKK